MTQQDRIVDQIINTIETDPAVRKRVFEGMGIPAYVGDAVITPIRNDIQRVGPRLRNLHSIVIGPVSERGALASVLAHLPDFAPDPSNEEVLLSQVDRIGTASGEYMDPVRDARSRGMLERPTDDYLRLVMTDLVVRATSGDQIVMVAVEISTTVDNKDVGRALDSAKLLSHVFGVTTVPAVSGPSIRPYTLLYAERAGVAYIRVEPEEEDPWPDEDVSSPEDPVEQNDDPRI